MRTRALLFVAFILAFTNARTQQIVNGGFEDWSDVLAFENLDEWSTGNGQIPGVTTTTKVAGASGTYAARLQTAITGTDTAFGFVLHGDFMGDFPVGGVAFATEVDAVEGWYRYDVQPGDSALIVVGFWSGGALVSFDIHRIGGSQPAWTSFDLPVHGGVPIQPDSVTVAATSSDPFNPAGIADGSWMEVDAIQLTASTVVTPDVLPNNDMELWSDIITEEPDGWSTFNQELATLAVTPVTKSGLANSGNWSVRIETLDLGGDTLPGVLANGAISFDGPAGGIPYTDMPTSLDGYFMYEPNGADTAIIFAQFMAGGVPVGNAVYGFAGTVPAWTVFSTPVTILFAPDTLLLVIFSGDNPGSVLHLDDLSFAIPTRVHEEAGAAIALYPNPVADELFIALPETSIEVQVRIIDAMGRIMAEHPARSVATAPIPIQVAHLGAGHYWLEVICSGVTQRLLFVKQ